MCKQCLITANHDVCVLNYVNDMNSHADNQNVNVSNTANQKKRKAKVKKSKKLGPKERLASPKPKKPRTYLRWSPTRRIFDCSGKLIKSSDSKCQSNSSKGCPNLFMGLGHNLFSVGQLYDSDLEVAFRRNTCFVRNLKGVDLLKGNHTTNLYIINLHEIASASPICRMARATSTKPIRVDSINGKRYVLVIVDDYSCYTWVHFLRSKDEAPEEIKTFQKKIQVLLQAPVIIAEAIATACYTQNRSIIHRRFDKTPYEFINEKNPDISFLHVFGALCYPKNDREDIGKLGANGDIGLFICYSTNSCAYRVYNRRTRKIMKTMNVTRDELSAMAFEQRSSKHELQGMTFG
ncbi:integrase, catalytic region, zinc finger, CCHC-type containing protein [Tanacetum coccineum]